MSDTQSLASEELSSSTLGSSSLVEVEECGKLLLEELNTQSNKKKLVVYEDVLALLLEDGSVLLGQVKPDRNSSDSSWALINQTLLTSVPNSVALSGGRVMDIALVSHPGAASDKKTFVMVLLSERKNKERFLSSHLVTPRRSGFDVSEETSVYDKSNVLGKNIMALASDHESIFTVSNLVRKIRLEEVSGEPSLKPTSARAQVPNDCQDGTLSLCAVTRAKSKTTNVILASKTKSAGKNKYGIEWYACNRKDELSVVKGASSRINEDSEPVAVLSDPKDGRSVFAIFNNRISGSSSLHKISKNSSSANDNLFNWNFLVSGAAFGWINDLLTIFVMTEGSNKLHVACLHKTDGFRSCHPCCRDTCPVVQWSPSHVLSCSNHKWRLSRQLFEEQISPASNSVVTILLASLFTDSTNDGSTFVTEPESGQPYRVRVVNCPIKGMHAEAILLEDLERCFDGDFTVLSKSTLRICLSSKPSMGAFSLLSSWAKSDKVGSIELFYVKPSGSDDVESGRGILVKAISVDKFCHILIDNDWTEQLNQRPSSSLMESTTGNGGTFTLEETNGFNNGETPKTSSNLQRPMSASVCSSSSRYGSRIPMAKSAKSSTVMSASANLSSLEHAAVEEVSAVVNSQEDLEETNQRLRALVSKLSATLSTILDVDVALRNNLMNLHECIAEVQEELAPKH